MKAAQAARAGNIRDRLLNATTGPKAAVSGPAAMLCSGMQGLHATLKPNGTHSRSVKKDSDDA